MTEYGVLPAGFVIKPLTAIQQSIVEKLQASSAVGPSQDYSSTAPLGQIVGAASSEIAEVWELGYLVHTSGDPEGTLDVPLDQLLALTGSSRIGARASRVEGALLNLDAGTLVPAGSLVSVLGRPDIQFELEEDVENAGVSPADVPGNFVCTVLGPVSVNADTLTVIDNPISGWNSVTNPDIAIIGRNVATNIEFRQRWADERAQAGSTTVSAIRACLLDTTTTPEFETIEKVLVLQNKTNWYDANGLPPHSVEAIIDDGDTPSVDDDLIAQVLWDSGVAGGIDTHGDQSGTAIDSEGDEQTVYFSRVTRREVFINMSITRGANFPNDGAQKLKISMAASGNEYQIDDDVIALYLKSKAFAVTGVADVPAFAIGLSFPPTLEANIPMGYRERAVFDVDRISVVVL